MAWEAELEVGQRLNPQRSIQHNLARDMKIRAREDGAVLRFTESSTPITNGRSP